MQEVHSHISEERKALLLSEAATTVSGLQRDFDIRETKIKLDEANRDVRIIEDIHDTAARRVLSIAHKRVIDLSDCIIVITNPE